MNDLPSNEEYLRRKEHPTMHLYSAELNDLKAMDEKGKEPLPFEGSFAGGGDVPKGGRLWQRHLPP